MYLREQEPGSFPHPDDVPAGLEHAFGQVVDEAPAVHALTLGAAVTVFHPFVDGNGRTSRVAHAALAGMSGEAIQDLGIVAFHEAVRGDGAARKHIDLKPPQQLRSFIRQIVYGRTNVPMANCRADTQITEHGERLLQRAKLGMTMRDSDDLNRLISPGWNGQLYFPDPDSLTYALIVAGREGIPIRGHTVNHTEPNVLFLVDMAKTVAKLEANEMQVLFDAAWTFRRERARATIDCTLPGEVGDRVVTVSDGALLTARECYIRYTNNLVSPSAAAARSD